MVGAISPDWLPAGWSVQFRVQNRGRTTRIYTELETGKKFFSENDVLRYTKKATDWGEVPQPTHTKKPLDKSNQQLPANTDEYPEWLPDGWKVELRTRKSGMQAGKEYKCYTDPLNELTFYSKPEVLRYLKTLKRKSCRSRSNEMVNHKRCIINTETVAAMQLPSKVVVEKHSVEDLPPGWILEIKVRKVANGTKRDPYYTDPVHGYIFRSKKQVIRYLQTGEINKHTIKPKSMGTNDIKLTDDEYALSSATKKAKLKHPVTRRQLAEARNSFEPSGLHLQEAGISELQDKRPREYTYALGPITEVSQEKHCTQNLVEDCVETKGNCSSSWTSPPKADPSNNHAGKRSSPRLAVLSNKCVAKRSKLQDKRVTDGAVPLKHLSENVIENCAKTKDGAVPSKHLSENMIEYCAKMKEDCSPRKSIQLIAEHVNKCEDKISFVGIDGCSTGPAKVIICEDGPALTPAASTLNENSHISQMEKSNRRRFQIDGTKSKQKEKLNLPRRSSKRLAGLEPEPVNSLVSTVQALQVTMRKSSKGKGSLDADLVSDFVNRASQQLGDASKTEVAHHNMKEIISTLQGEKLSKVKRPFDGVELQSVDTLVSDEQTVHIETRNSGRGEPGRDAGSASDDFIIEESLQLGDPSEPEAAHDTLTDIHCTSRGEPLNKGKMIPQDQLVPKEQHHNLEPEKMDAEKPGPELSFLIGSDPCLEFAFKTLTGELPIADAVDNRTVLKPAIDAVQKENTLETGSCSRKTRAIPNRSKKAKVLNLPHRTSKRLAGVEPELLEPMSNERALRNITPKSSRRKALQVVESACEAPQECEVGHGNKVAHDLCTIMNLSPHEESLTKIEQTLEDQAVPEEKPRELEIEEAAVENSVSQFSFPFLDTWSDPCLDFAFKTLTGEIPIEDDLFQGYFQENPVTSHNQRDNLALPDFGLPDFGSPNFFQSDIAPHVAAPEQSVSGQQLSPMSSLPPAGNVNLPNCNGVGFGQQLSMNASFLPAGNLKFSSGSGVGSGQYLSMNSSFSPSGNVGQPNWSGVVTQNPSLGGKTDFHGKVKS